MNPEDPNEVPGGFLSDVAPVSLYISVCTIDVLNRDELILHVYNIPWCSE